MGTTRSRKYSILVVVVVLVLTVVAALVLVGPELLDRSTYEPPALTRDERGNVTATCRGQIYEGSRRIATKEDVDALKNTTCVRGDLTIGVERCDRFSQANKPPPVTLATLKGLRKIEVVTGTLRVQGIDGLTTLQELERLATAGAIELCESGALKSVHLPALRAVSTVTIPASSAVSAVELPQLETIKMLKVSSGARLERFSTGAAAQIGAIMVEGEFGVQGTDGAVDVPWLAEVTAVDTLTISRAASLRTVVAPKLKSVDTLRIGDSQNLEAVSLPALERARVLTVSSVAALNKVEVPALAGAVDDLNIDRAPRLASLTTGPITAVRNLNIRNSGLRSLAFLEQASSFSNMVVQDNPQLEELGLKSLVSIGAVAGEIARNPRLMEKGREKLAALATGSRLKMCENGDQPPCRWDAPFLGQRMTPPTQSIKVDGVKLRVTSENVDAEALVALKGAPGFSPLAEYHLYRRGFTVTAVKFVAGTPVEVLRLRGRMGQGVDSINLPPKVKLEELAVFDTIGGVAIVGKKAAPGGAFVVNVVFAGENQAPMFYGDVDVTALAKDARIPMRGLNGVAVTTRAGSAPFSIAFATNPSDMTYPNLPLVLEDRGGVLTPLATLQTAKTP